MVQVGSAQAQGGATTIDAVGGLESPFEIASSGADALGSRGFNQFLDQIQPSDTQPLKFLEPNADPFSGNGGSQQPPGGPSSPVKPLVFA
jgi:hypothetical protein